MLPKKLAPLLFGLLLSGIMSLLVSGISTWRAVGLGPGFATTWAGAWLMAWPIAFPAVLLAAPLARRAVERLVSGREVRTDGLHGPSTRHAATGDAPRRGG
jgi:Protein of unknown function (DUF2798)